MTTGPGVQRNMGGTYNAPWQASAPLNLFDQLCPNAINNTLIFPALGLPEKTNRRIPGTLLTMEQPSVVRHIRQKYPCGATKSTCEMSDAGIDSDDQIETRDQSCGVGEIDDLLGKIDNIAPLLEKILVCRPGVFLQADKQRVDIKDAGQHLQRRRTVVVVVMFWIPGPDKANPHFVTSAKTPFPGFNVMCRESWQVSPRSRNGFELGLEDEWQTV